MRSGRIVDLLSRLHGNHVVVVAELEFDHAAFERDLRIVRILIHLDVERSADDLDHHRIGLHEKRMVPVGSHVEKGLSVEFHRAVVRTERLAVAQGRSLRQPDLRSVQQPEGFGFAAGIGECIVRFHGRLVHVVADEVAAHDECDAEHGGGAPTRPAYDPRTLGAVRRRIRVDAGVHASSDLRIRCGSFSTEFRSRTLHKARISQNSALLASDSEIQLRTSCSSAGVAFPSKYL